MRRKMVSLLLVFALVFSLSSGVFAADSHTGDGGISPQYINFCSRCESTMSLDCAKWDYGYAGKWVDTGSHGSCKILYYQSLSYWHCHSCGYTYSTGSYHYCYEQHSSCGKGIVKDCNLNYM